MTHIKLNIKTVHARPDGTHVVNLGAEDEAAVLLAPIAEDENAGDLINWLRGNKAQSWPINLPDVKAGAKRSVIGWINALTEQLTSKYSTIEIAGFVAKKIEAEKVQGGEPGPFPMLESEATLTGETVTDLAAVVLTKDAAYEAITATVTGLRRNTFTAIDAATGAPDVQAAIDAAKVSASGMAEAMGLAVPDALSA